MVLIVRVRMVWSDTMYVLYCYISDVEAILYTLSLHLPIIYILSMCVSYE
jgi:hypothetical protein